MYCIFIFNKKIVNRYSSVKKFVSTESIVPIIYIDSFLQQLSILYLNPKNMKTKSIVLMLMITSFSFSQAAYGQFKFGVKAGLSSQNISYSDLLITSGQEFQDLKLRVKEAGLGIHFGVMAQINLSAFFIQPELIFNSNSVGFQLEDISDEFGNTVFKEQYQNLDIPILLGARLGPIRIGAGPVAHVHINSTSDLFKFKEYSQNFKNINYGWQGGLGLDLWKLHFDLRYEGNFSRFGDHIEWEGSEYAFSDSPTRVLASVAISF